jgi:glycosyltransferase involved in cell wall biosynthesis
MRPLAYLNSEYPSLSHTFIEREIRHLRESGIEVRTFSARRASAKSAPGATNAAAAADTVSLQTGTLSTVLAALVAAASRPAGFLKALIASQRLSPGGVAARLRHAAYAAQGAILARHLRRLGIEHVHVHMANNGAAIAMMACEADSTLSYSLSIHGSAEFFHVDSWTLAPKVERAEFVRCISHFCKAQVMTWTDPDAWRRFHIVRCGIDPQAFSPRPEREPGPLRLLTVGRLHPIKGYNVLLEACRLLADRRVPFELVMVGDGPMSSRLSQDVERLGLSRHVTLAGGVPQERIQAHFDRADAIVVSSFMEGVPVVLMEAMAKELGVVSTRVGGIAELVAHGESGWLVDAGSAESLAEGIRRYGADPHLCRVHGRVGRRRVLESYDIAASARAMADLFRARVSAPARERKAA